LPIAGLGLAHEGLARHPHHALWLAREHLRQRVRGRERRAGLGDAAGQAELERLLRAERAAGEQHHEELGDAVGDTVAD
jgi:hypothetical protein